MDEVNCQGEQYDRIRLMDQGYENIHIGQNCEYAKYDLKRNNTHQPLESILNILRVILFSDNVKDIGHSEQSQERKPAMDEDDSLRSLENVDERTEQVRGNQFAE